MHARQCWEGGWGGDHTIDTIDAIHISVQVYLCTTYLLYAHCTLSLPPRQVALAAGLVSGAPLSALARLTLEVPAAAIKLWQPAGRLPVNSRQQLYTAHVCFIPAPHPTSAGATGAGALDHTQHTTAATGSRRQLPDVPVGGNATGCLSRRVGFRSFELVRVPLRDAAADLLAAQTAATQHADKDAATGESSGRDSNSDSDSGESFYFRVNGVPLFAKGANLVPLHVLSSAASNRLAAALVADAAAAGMNMLRVWGGGLYQVGVQHWWCEGGGR